MGRFSCLVEKVRLGDLEATDELAAYFVDAALEIARFCLPVSPTASVDHEDIANSALKSFFVRLQDGKLEYQGDRQLIAALRKIVKAKTNRLFEKCLAGKRDVRKLRSELPVGSFAMVHTPVSVMDDKLADEFSPTDKIVVERILGALQDELHGLFLALISELQEYPRKVLFLMLEADHSNEEMAQRIGKSVASIERYRKLIRVKLLQCEQKTL